jgi:hypothetical protein
MASNKKTRSGRTVKAPRRFKDLNFVSGSGFVGCDHYDTGYDNGAIHGNYKDAYQASEDIQYGKDLEKAMMVAETARKLPNEIGREISGFLTRRSHYQSDINFIAPDNVEPERIRVVEEEEEEWVSGDETSEDEWYESDDE